MDSRCQIIIWTATPFIVRDILHYWFYTIGWILCTTLIFTAKYYNLPESDGEKEDDPATVTYCLQYRDLLCGVGSRTLYPHFFIYLVTLTPGFGLKLMSSPIFFFLYGAGPWAGSALTAVYILFYGMGRLLAPTLIAKTFRAGRLTYFIFSLFSAILLFLGPITVMSLPNGGAESLVFCSQVVVQGFFMGSFKGLQTIWLEYLWISKSTPCAHVDNDNDCDGDEIKGLQVVSVVKNEKEYRYDSYPAMYYAASMTNCGLCLAGVIGPITAYVSFAGDPDNDVTTASVDFDFQEALGWRLWFYLAGALQAFAMMIVMPYCPLLL